MNVVPDIAIEVDGLKKSFGGRQVVRNVSPSVKHGAIYGLCDPNGCGKTTTIRMLCGLINSDEGHGVCHGYDIRTQRDEINRLVGYMPQHFGLYRDLLQRDRMTGRASILIDAPHRKRPSFGDWYRTV